MSYLQTAWGDSIDDDVSIDDIVTAINQIQEMDEEHGAFWVGIGEEENTLEVSKDLSIFAVFAEDGSQIKAQFNSWEEVKALYESFLEERYDLVRKALG